jgi:hypothetical protein
MFKTLIKRSSPPLPFSKIIKIPSHFFRADGSKVPIENVFPEKKKIVVFGKFK